MNLESTQDESLLVEMTLLARASGARLLERFARSSRPTDRAGLIAAARGNEEASMAGLREALARLRPQAGWVDDALESAPLPAGEWWVVDAVEGNVNHIHGMGEWCVTLTLVRDGAPALAVAYQPVGELLYTARRGGGAWVNGAPLRVSSKAALDAAIVATGQAEAAQTHTHQNIGRSITAMLGHALLVRSTVPSTFPMLLVASGQNDVFWQYEPVLPGVAAGWLFVAEAGGVVSRIDGTPWTPGSPDILVAPPQLHAASVRVLSAI